MTKALLVFYNASTRYYSYSILVIALLKSDTRIYKNSIFDDNISCFNIRNRLDIWDM